ncbi:MAG TPA: glucosamine-6-phosphate deaminase [Thermoanaerobaculia bacterium]|jgi:glucosamine-6-phosphate deaminase|nr:glucosamine-6-phosphate deaminase [Thermoanaerobaculia bacterium]
MNWETLPSYDVLSDRAAEVFLAAILRDPRVVLGLPTGRTPVRMYERVVAACGRAYHCFRDVVTFNLDEYVGIDRTHPGSYYSFMKGHLFDFVDIDPANAHLPNSAAADIVAECARYERGIAAAGGLDLTFLGLGSNGHIAFNEPGTPFDSRTRAVTLTESTRAANAALFGESVPTHAITMGIATILESKSIVLLASGDKKRHAIERLRNGEITEEFPASALWRHPDVTVLTA